MPLANGFREKDSVVSDEPLFEFASETGVYTLKGTPRRYQPLLETLKVLFPVLEVRLGIPEDYGDRRLAGLVHVSSGQGMQFILYKEGYDLADNPGNFAGLVGAVARWVQSLPVTTVQNGE